MSVLYRIGTALPEYQLKQQEAKKMIEKMLPNRQLSKYLAVFDTAEIDTRYFVAEPYWFTYNHGLHERNDLFMNKGIHLAERAVANCLEHSELDSNDIDSIITVTSTGILTPSLDVHLINHFSFRDDVIRQPYFGLGCAGGGIGLSRAHDYLQAHPTQAVMVVAVEIASVAFHHNHLSPQDIVGSALFGDGASCAILLGSEHPLLQHEQSQNLNIVSTSSKILRNSMDVMGWNVKDDGFYVIFATSIPKIVRTFWREHLNEFLNQSHIQLRDIDNILAHPGGRKVIEEIEQVMYENQSIHYSKQVLKRYGNMSSPTVLFVIDEALKNKTHTFNHKYQLASALGPGFSSELLLMEWK